MCENYVLVCVRGTGSEMEKKGHRCEDKHEQLFQMGTLMPY